MANEDWMQLEITDCMQSKLLKTMSGIYWSECLQKEIMLILTLSYVIFTKYIH